jgi:adenylate kinase
MYLVFLGPPGAGKGTQAALVSKKMGLAHIATGDLFRGAVEKGSELGKLVKSYMEKGELVPDDVTVRVVSERISEPDCKAGCIFDGFPRTLEQARALDTTLAEQGKKVDKVIYIEVEEEALLQRLGGRWTCSKCGAVYHEVASPPRSAGKCDKCGGELYQRADDNIQTIKERLKVYFAQTAPLLEYYNVGDKLIRVEGESGIEAVAGKIMDALGVK